MPEAFETPVERLIQCSACHGKPVKVKAYPASVFEGNFEHYCGPCKARVGHHIVEPEEKPAKKVLLTDDSEVSIGLDRKPVFDFSTDGGPSAKPAKKDK